MARVMLRKNADGAIYLAHPQTGEALTRVVDPPVQAFWSYVSTAYEHPRGILFPDVATARNELRGKHTIVED